MKLSVEVVGDARWSRDRVARRDSLSRVTIRVTVGFAAGRSDGQWRPTSSAQFALKITIMTRERRGSCCAVEVTRLVRNA